MKLSINNAKNSSKSKKQTYITSPSTRNVVWTSIQLCLCYGHQMDVKTTLCAYKNPVNTRRYLDVDTTFFECYETSDGRQNNVVFLLG